MAADKKKAEAKPEVWPRVIKLKHPFDFVGERITELTFQRGKLGAIKGMKLDAADDVDQLMMIASRLCGQPMPLLEMLDAEDGDEVLEVALLFFVKCLPTLRVR